MSTDLDFDANKDVNLESVIYKAFDSYYGENKPILLNLNLKKHTETVKKYIISYKKHDADRMETLKIEMSFRRKYRESEINVINDIKIYKLPLLFDFKINAFNDRTVARDLHDIIFIGKNYAGDLNAGQINFIKDIYKNLDAIFNKYYIAYKEDDILKDRFLEDLSDLEKLVSKRLLNNSLENKLKNNTLSSVGIQKYASAYLTSGLEAAVKQIKQDGKDANWIIHYRDKIFPDRTLTEVEKALKAAEKDKGMGRR